MNLTSTEQEALLDDLVGNGIHYLLHNGHLAGRYASVPFGQKEAAPDVEAIESGKGNYYTYTIPQEEGDCQCT